MAVPRIPLTRWSSTNQAPTGRNPWGENRFLGQVIQDEAAGRRYKFVQIALSGVSAAHGFPVAYVSTAKVTPDISDALGDTTVQGTDVFAGILVTSTTISPVTGSTAYGWIMTHGPLGKVPGSLLADQTVKTYVSGATASADEGRAFCLSTLDRALVDISTLGSTSDEFRVPRPGYIHFGASVGTSTRTSVSKGYVTAGMW